MGVTLELNTNFASSNTWLLLAFRSCSINVNTNFFVWFPCGRNEPHLVISLVPVMVIIVLWLIREMETIGKDGAVILGDKNYLNPSDFSQLKQPKSACRLLQRWGFNCHVVTPVNKTLENIKTWLIIILRSWNKPPSSRLELGGLFQFHSNDGLLQRCRKL